MLPDLIVLGERPTQQHETKLWNEDEIRGANRLTVDNLLATDPSFSLYRRQSSLFAHPTASGISLRRTGATATARTLVLRDGIPQNDPFGGWISWTRYRPDTLESISLTPSAAASIWGNQSPAGVVQLTSRQPQENRALLHSSFGSHQISVISAQGESVIVDEELAVQANFFSIQSDGFHTLQASQRGAIDRKRDLDVRGAEVRTVWQPTDAVSIEASVSIFEEQRGNGTPLSRNESDATDVSLGATWQSEAFHWQALAYYQHRDFRSLFSSVSADRMSERPALDQFDVPGQGIGGVLSAHRNIASGVALSLGIDSRHVRGETNELAGFVNGSYLRQREAGGRQTTTGVFARSSWEPNAGTLIEASVRADYWNLSDGRRLEFRPSDGSTLSDSRFDDRHRMEPSAALMFSHELGDSWIVGSSLGTSYRAPTLNELYRPFRVRSDITEANPLLDPERFYSVDVEASWIADDNLTITHTVFAHWIDSAIANVPLTDPGAAGELGVFVPLGGSLSQRQNVDEARVWGLESRATWEPVEPLSLSAVYIFSEAEFTDSPSQPLLEAQSFPHTPSHQIQLQGAWQVSERLAISAALGYTDSAFEDILGSRKLDSYWKADFGASFQVSDHFTMQANIENAFDEEIQTGVSSSGLISTGVPLSLWISATLDW